MATLGDFGLSESNRRGHSRTIYLHRVPLQQISLRLELTTHEAIQVGDYVHDFGADAAGKMAYAVLKFEDWAVRYPSGKRCKVGCTGKRDSEIVTTGEDSRDSSRQPTQLTVETSCGGLWRGLCAV